MSCLSVSLFPLILDGQMTVPDYARLCKSVGLDGFDLGMVVLKNHTPRYIHDLKEELNEVGLPLVMLTTYPDFTHPDPLQREREYDFLVHDIAFASALNAKYLRVTAGQSHPGIDISEAVDQVVKYIRKASEVADRYGIELVFENHSISKGWFYRDISNSSKVFLEILSRLSGSSISVNFDTANLLVAGEENILDVLRQVIKKVRTIHVADVSTIGNMDPVQLGTGIVPMKEIFGFLKKENFDGWLCLEIWKDEGVAAVKKAVQDVKAIWARA